MVTATTRPLQYSPNQPVLYLAFELGERFWKLGFTTGFGQRPRARTIAARDRQALALEIQRARQRFGLPDHTPVLSCYEAGRDGFWLHRYLLSQGIDNLIVDSASIEVQRRKRRAKTDRLDLTKLLRMLIRYQLGETKVWSVVHVPSPQAEDQRHLHRQLASLKGDRTRQINRLKGLLASQGLALPVKTDFLDRLPQVRLWDGSPLPPGLLARLHREFAQLQFLQQHIRALQNQRMQAIRTSPDPPVAQVRQLLQLRGIGPTSAWLYVFEFFAWRDFRNRRQVGALAGLTPTPHQSGDEAQERGISKAGNRYVRALAIEIAWAWLQHQPTSQLSLWYQQRFGHGSKRLRKIGIVALARKLLIALWRYLETGTLPEGALLKA